MAAETLVPLENIIECKDETLDWLDEHVGYGRWNCWNHSETHLRFVFLNDKDAVLFKLRWG